MIIFGGAGFIGRHLCEHLAALGRTTLVVSRNPDRTLFEDLSPCVTCVSLSDFLNGIEKHLAGHRTVVYAAAASVPATFVDRPWMELSTNVEPAFELFKRILDVEPKIRLVLLSSGGTIYGSGHTRPISETSPARPISPYGFGKLALEEAVRYLGRMHNLDYVILRISNPVGRFQSNPAHGIVTVALRHAMHGDPVTLFNGGNQVRDFMDADDLARAIVLAANAVEHRRETWNVGSGTGHSVKDIVDIVETVIDRRIERRIVAGRAVDVDYVVLDISRIANDLGWRPEVEIHESIRKLHRQLT